MAHCNEVARRLLARRPLAFFLSSLGVQWTLPFWFCCFVCLLVVIRPKNLYFASLSVVEVRHLRVYLLGPSRLLSFLGT